MHKCSSISEYTNLIKVTSHGRLVLNNIKTESLKKSSLRNADSIETSHNLKLMNEYLSKLGRRPLKTEN